MKIFGRKMEDETPADVAQAEPVLALATHPLVSNDACEVHKHHQPRPTYCELHHLVPRSWQYAWHPGEPTADTGIQISVGYTDLFDNKTISICPTGHRNVHHWLTRLMHEWQKTLGDMHTVASAVSRSAAADHLPLSARELAIAEEAMTRWIDAGGSLLALCNKSLYGQI